jgi:hypothetical protein
VGAVKAPTIQEELPMQTITTIGLDIAKSVFQVHGVDAESGFGRMSASRQKRSFLKCRF